MGKRMNENIVSENEWLSAQIYGNMIKDEDRRARARILKKALKAYIYELC
jgi:hypothetical protein